MGGGMMGDMMGRGMMGGGVTLSAYCGSNGGEPIWRHSFLFPGQAGWLGIGTVRCRFFAQRDTNPSRSSYRAMTGTPVSQYMRTL